jgi:flavin reductase (DIM6/NTAB) family NADH-FMN oxidoreductase RutF
VSGGTGTEASAAPELDTLAFRRTIGLFATGVTVITTCVGDVIHGMTANAVSSVSLDPLLLLVCIDRRARMCGLVQQAGGFAVNVLSDRQADLSRHFAGSKGGPEPPTLVFERDPAGGAPYIHGCLAAIRCRVESVLDGGDHIVVLGRVVHFQPGPAREPLLFFGGRYRFLREPETVASAPESWNNDAVRIFHEAWADPVEESHPIA